MQVFIVSNRDSTYYFANNNNRHFSFNADERFLPIYQYAAPDNTKITGLDEFGGRCRFCHPACQAYRSSRDDDGERGQPRICEKSRRR